MSDVTACAVCGGAVIQLCVCKKINKNLGQSSMIYWSFLAIQISDYSGPW